MLRMLHLVVLVTVVTLAHATTDETHKPLQSGEDDVTQGVAPLDNQSVAGSDDVTSKEEDDVAMKEKAFFAFYRTITRTGVSLATSTVYITCLSGTEKGTKQCTGRKKRDIRTKIADSSDKNGHGLDSSKTDATSEEEDQNESLSSQRFVGGVYTIWTTSTTSTTVTSFYTDSSTTVSLSYYCMANGIEYPTVFC